VSAVIEIDLDGTAPAGVLTSGDDCRYPFSGWVELAAAIEAWRVHERAPRKPTGEDELIPRRHPHTAVQATRQEGTRRAK
jgi:hypothetical protein